LTFKTHFTVPFSKGYDLLEINIEVKEYKSNNLFFIGWNCNSKLPEVGFG
jgi:hypothetical protein